MAENEGSLILNIDDIRDGTNNNVALMDLYGITIFNAEIEDKINKYEDNSKEELITIKEQVFTSKEQVGKEEINRISKQVFQKQNTLVKKEQIELKTTTQLPYILMVEIMTVLILLVSYGYYKKKKKERELHLDHLNDTDNI